MISAYQTTGSLNTILYGPPGTGKTYHTIQKSVQIANPDFFLEPKTRDEIKSEYERLKNEGQIEFITFHQSMSYEDFIEGIKPKKPEPKEGDTYLKYIIEEGLFKRIAKRADYRPTPQAAIFSLTDQEFTKASFYKLSLGNTAIEDDEQIYRYCLDYGYIALGWGGANDFSGKTEHEIQQMVPDKLEKFAAQAINYFIHFLKKNDFVVVSYGNLRFRAIGKVIDDYEYRNVEGLEVKQFRKVEWLLKDVDIPVEELYNRQFSQQAIYKLNKSEIKREFFVKAHVSKQDSDIRKNYVLIIDEINRGNIAQIFGELITLIEPDKRKGGKEALEAILPYSKEFFSVPQNLYLLGTMNTADRSVEALDTALRRRFTFEPMMPKPELLESKRLMWQFLWKHKGDLWVNPHFQQIEQQVYSFFGTDESFEKGKKDIWHEMEKDKKGKHEGQIAWLDKFNFTGINLQQLLSAINLRLEALLTKDHVIGHAWLMDVYSLTDLRNAFKNKILPLLQEYFYNNLEKIALILGEDWIIRKNAKGIFPKNVPAGSELKSDYEERMLITLKNPLDANENVFHSIYA